MDTLYSIGHSNHEWTGLLQLLRRHEITALADVRSAPYSRYNPQFNREVLAESLKQSGIEYVHLGRELGARREEPECYDSEGRVRYDRAARTPAFLSGLDRLRKGMSRYRVTIMCAEKDPLECHRSLLVCRGLREELELRHIRVDGTAETQFEMESRLLKLFELPSRDLFRSREELLEEAYAKRSEWAAYVRPADASSGSSEEFEG